MTKRSEAETENACKLAGLGEQLKRSQHLLSTANAVAADAGGQCWATSHELGGGDRIGSFAFSTHLVVNAADGMLECSTLRMYM